MSALVVAFAQPAECPLCEGHRILDIQPLDGRSPAVMPCPLCVEPKPVYDFLTSISLQRKATWNDQDVTT